MLWFSEVKSMATQHTIPTLTERGICLMSQSPQPSLGCLASPTTLRALPVFSEISTLCPLSMVSQQRHGNSRSDELQAASHTLNSYPPSSMMRLEEAHHELLLEIPNSLNTPQFLRNSVYYHPKSHANLSLASSSKSHVVIHDIYFIGGSFPVFRIFKHQVNTNFHTSTHLLCFQANAHTFLFGHFHFLHSYQRFRLCFPRHIIKAKCFNIPKTSSTPYSPSTSLFLFPNHLRSLKRAVQVFNSFGWSGRSATGLFAFTFCLDPNLNLNLHLNLKLDTTSILRVNTTT
ncbi:hypothetical protein MKZ38_008519 [Zalerion maritima]|uniref:Uncharacterized protein n=1 Tax=Zalerion maritima TaxID=339359 RepID=A0AAD5WNJ9_9PEZI|nr:hypothetical protein MKZ38_008519 [Zalerion maritima]